MLVNLLRSGDILIHRTIVNIAEDRTTHHAHATHLTSEEHMLRPRQRSIAGSSVHRTYDTTSIEIETSCRSVISFRGSSAVATAINSWHWDIDINIRREIVKLYRASHIATHLVIGSLHATYNATYPQVELIFTIVNIETRPISTCTGIVHSSSNNTALSDINIVDIGISRHHTGERANGNVSTTRVVKITILMEPRLSISERTIIYVMLKDSILNDDILDYGIRSCFITDLLCCTTADTSEQAIALRGMLIVGYAKRTAAPYLTQVFDYLTVAVEGTAERMLRVINILAGEAADRFKIVSRVELMSYAISCSAISRRTLYPLIIIVRHDV